MAASATRRPAMSIHASFISLITTLTRPDQPPVRRSATVAPGLSKGSRVRLSG